jgi:hypothetical protein
MGVGLTGMSLYLYLILRRQHLVQPRRPLGGRLPGKMRSYPGDWPLNFRCGYPGRQNSAKAGRGVACKGIGMYGPESRMRLIGMHLVGMHLIGVNLSVNLTRGSHKHASHGACISYRGTVDNFN